MKNILVGINYSATSPVLLRYARKLAQFFEASLTAAHIVRMNTINVSELKGIEEKELGRLQLFVQSTHAKQFDTIPTQIRVGFGESHLELSAIATEIGADLMIINAHKEIPFFDWLFENHGKAIINNIFCPVLMIPTMADYSGFNRLVYATDFLFGDLEALLYLQDWATVYKAKLLFLHICQNEAEYADAERKMALLQRIFPNAETHIFKGKIVQSINDYLKLNHADLVATTTRQKGLWQSVFQSSITNKIAKETRVPMLIFKEKIK